MIQNDDTVWDFPKNYQEMVSRSLARSTKRKHIYLKSVNVAPLIILVLEIITIDRIILWNSVGSVCSGEIQRKPRWLTLLLQL
jgi:hypothetical protein